MFSILANYSKIYLILIWKKKTYCEILNISNLNSDLIDIPIS